MVTVNELFRIALARLGNSNQANLEAREIVKYALDVHSDEDFYEHRQSTELVNSEVYRAFSKALERRLSGEPLAYIINQWDFYGLNFCVNMSVLIPRPDTELIIDISRRIMAGQKDMRIADLCCGSGCIGITLMHYYKNCTVFFLDLMELALDVAQRNIERHELKDRSKCVQADVRDVPVFREEFDLIVCNPPYIPTGDIAGLDASVRDYEPAIALDGGSSGLAFYKPVAKNWQPALKNGGVLLLECGVGQAADVSRILRDCSYEDICIHKDLAGIERVVSGIKHII